MRHRKRWRDVFGDYHVFNRGARKMAIVSDDRDRRYFVRLIALSARKHGVWVLAWCLMDNHYHMCVRADGARMGRMVRDLEKTYARYFNKKTGHVGALFEGRFGSVWLPDMDATAYISRYIHANSRDKGRNPESYPWSSCRAYLRGKSSEWFDPRPVLDHVGGVDAYRSFLRRAPERAAKVSREDEAQAAFIDYLHDRVRRILPAGSDRFSTRLLACWAGIRLFALKPKLLARVLGFSSGKCVSANVARLSRVLPRHPELAAALSQVIVK
jgi:REP element-mobilizing transposase RayT